MICESFRAAGNLGDVKRVFDVHLGCLWELCSRRLPIWKVFTGPVNGY